MPKVTIDGVEHDTENLSAEAQNVIQSLRFVEQQLQQKRNELAVADTARAAYMQALKKSLAPHKISE
jgi:hypothetical protein